MTYLLQVVDWTRWFIGFGTIVAFAGFLFACGVTTFDMMKDANDWNKKPYYFLTSNARKYCLPAVVLGCVLLIVIPDHNSAMGMFR